MAAWSGQSWAEGGALSVAATIVLASPYAGRVLRLHGADAARTVTMPVARHWPAGHYLSVIANEQASNSVTVKDSAGTTLGTVGPDEVGKLLLVDNSTDAGVWLFVLWTGGIHT